MSVCASYTIVPRELVRKHQGSLSDLPLHTIRKSYDIDKAWLEFHLALREMPRPVSLAIRGDRPVYGVLEGGMIDIPEDEEGCEIYIALFTPALVKQIDQAVRTITPREILGAIQEQLSWKLDAANRKYYAWAFGRLKAAYRAAARADQYLAIFIS